MQFDLFHSIGRIDTVRPRLNDEGVFRAFLRQAQLADSLGFGTLWVAESHFSSEVQKSGPSPVIPHYQGEVGLNADSPQLAHVVLNQTKRIGFGTAIYNIVGGNGGPVAAADRIRSLAFLNSLRDDARDLHVGVASGRFPYINRPFGILPRSDVEAAHWQIVSRLILVEAVEIFLRLSLGEAIGSADLTQVPDTPGFEYRRRWEFDRLKLVPELPDIARHVRFVLGSADPMVRDKALQFADCDIFNLSFTPPAQIEGIHREMFARYEQAGRLWHRARLPRTVLVFVDPDSRRAQEMASSCFDTYIEAMRGTVAVPDKNVLLERALIGSPDEIREQLTPGARHGFHAEDRLMLWFEFNQGDSRAVESQMKLFAEKVMPDFAH